MIPKIQILIGDVRAKLRELPADSVQCVVTSPPYWALRAYGTPSQTWADGWVGELGLEPTPEMHVAHQVEVFREIRRVLKKDGVCWMNFGDSYISNAGGYDTGGSRGAKAKPSTIVKV